MPLATKKVESPKFSKGSALPTLNAAAAGADYGEGLDNYYDEEDEDSDDKDFNANELQAITGQKKVPENKKEVFKPSSPAANKRPALAAGADFEMELDDEDSDEDGDEWGVPENYVPNTDDLKDFDYSNTDLNKCGDYELKRHKLNMDKGYSKNILRKGDPGFEYDKRVEFKQPAKDQLKENSWDESGDNFNDDDYFDDDFN